MTSPVRFRLCSALAVETTAGTLTGRDLGTRKARTLLALLAAERGAPVTADRLADVLWPGVAPADPAANVATLASRSRRLLGEDVLAARGRSYALVSSRCTVDLDEAAQLVGEGRSRAASGATALTAAAARRALAVLGPGPALPDEGDADWVLSVRREADGLRRTARHLLASSTPAVDPAEAAGAAGSAVQADPYDERAVRDLMRARAAGAGTAAGLTAYDDLARVLRDDLGTEPGAATQALHLALLRGEPLTPEAGVAGDRPRRGALVGRDRELASIDERWAAAGAGRVGLVLLVGRAGMGKTRLLDAAADLAEASGGLVLRTRCRPAERSLFLQPYADAVRPVLLASPPGELADLLREHAGVWAGLVPEVAEVVEVVAEPRRSPAAERRRAHDAVAALLGRLALRQPVLLSLDDLQEAGSASIDLLAHLATRLDGSRVLLAGTVRSEARTTVGRLAVVATRVPVDVLPASAVEALAASSGLAARADEVLARTAGHALSVVECLRALVAGDDGVPATLAAAVAAQVGRLDDRTRDAVQAASVLQGPHSPQLLARLLATDEVTTAQRCEHLVEMGLLTRAGTQHEFVNDLVQESVRSALPPALAVAFHRRAADLSVERPEAMAEHALAAGEPERAGEGWLIAGRSALARSALDDARLLLDRALGVATDPSLRTRALLVRARTHEARTAFELALTDVDEALRLARDGGDRRLEMAALRARGGDVGVALHRPTAEVTASLEAGLRLASGLGDRRAESDFSGRLATLESSGLRFGAALRRARANLAHCRTGSSQEALVLALDGLKTVLAHVGAADELAQVVAELEPLLRRRSSTWLLQWTVFESSYVFAARDDWAAAAARVAAAVELNRRSGYSAYAGYFAANAAWFHRLAGDLDTALEQGERALEQNAATDHPWWHAAAAGLHAAALLESGLDDEAAVVARRGLASTDAGSAPAWHLRCLAPLALATGDEAVRAEATRLVESIDAPEAGAWLTGADAYLLTARAWRDVDRGRAADLLAPLVTATRHSWPALRVRAEAELAQNRSDTSRAARRAPSSGTAT